MALVYSTNNNNHNKIEICSEGAVAAVLAALREHPGSEKLAKIAKLLLDDLVALRAHPTSAELRAAGEMALEEINRPPARFRLVDIFGAIPEKELEGLSQLSPQQGILCKAAFAKVDTDGSGIISSEEMAAALSAAASQPLPKDQIKEMIAEVDVDGDGEMSFGEFIMALTRVPWGKMLLWTMLHQSSQAAAAGRAGRR